MSDPIDFVVGLFLALVFGGPVVWHLCRSRVVVAGLRGMSTNDRAALLRRFREDLATDSLKKWSWRLDVGPDELGLRRKEYVDLIVANIAAIATEVNGWPRDKYVQRGEDGADLLGPRLRLIVEPLERSLDELAGLRALIIEGDALHAERP